MRITGGDLTGRRVNCPPGTIRPAMDRMRESLFAILRSIDDLSFLDLFAGSGLVGLEAYSRGARPVVLVEKDPGKRSVIKENISGLDPVPRLFVQPVERFVARNRTVYAIVYLDPPFNYRYKNDLLDRLSRSNTIGEHTQVVIHAPAHEQIAEQHGRLVVTDRRTYGGSALWFFSSGGNDTP